MTQIFFQLLTNSVTRGDVTGCFGASVSTNDKMGQVSLARSQVTVSRATVLDHSGGAVHTVTGAPCSSAVHSLDNERRHLRCEAKMR